MVYSPTRIKDAKNLHSEINDYFGQINRNNNFAASPNTSSNKFSKLSSLLSDNRMKFGYLFLAYLVTSLFILYKIKPNMIYTFYENRTKKISYYLLFKYSVVSSLTLTIISSILIYRNEKLKPYLFSGDCNNSCNNS